MKVINTEKVPIKMWLEDIEEGALNQAKNLANLPFVYKWVAIMPDSHQGYGMPIGGVLATTDVIIPNAVGVDIGCFSGDIRIRLIDNTTKSLLELFNNKENPIVFCCDKNGKIKVKKSTVHKTRHVKTLLLITLDNNEVIKCTEDHEFLMRSLEYKRSDSLEIGDSLAPLNLFYDRDNYLTCNNNLQQKNFKKSDVWSSIHNLVAEEFKIYNNNLKNPTIHHEDENKSNNYPTNLTCKSSSEHNSYHAKKRNYFATEEFKKKRIKILEEKGFYDPSLYGKKKQVALDNLKILFKSEGYKNNIKNAGQRGKKYFKNSDINFIKLQREGRVSKILKSCMETFGEINENNYELTRKNYYNSFPTYKTMLKILKEYNYNSVVEYFTKRNHKIKSIQKIETDEDVFCLNVPEYHNFALSSGVFVHNCGMGAIQTNIKNIPTDTLKEVMGKVRKIIPVGFNHHKDEQDWEGFNRAPDIEIIQKELSSAKKQLGTLGGGNHFIEFQTDDQNNLWVMLHSGSRNFGLKTANVYHKKAQELCNRWYVNLVDKDLAFLPIEEKIGQEYQTAMTYCLEFAKASRHHMMNSIIDILLETVGNFSLTSEINIHHNYAALENHYGKNVFVHRKGATRVREGEKGIIPGSMGTPSYIVEGLGNPLSFCSSSHGAGRKMGRKDAERSLNLEEEQSKMTGIIHGLRDKGNLDEAPGAYKDIDVVMENQKDLVKILVKLKPLASIKG